VMKPLRKVNLRWELEIPRSWKRILMGRDPHLKVVIKCN
jgi:predicted DNA-binding antitoxin AbrB/MazE fold protein